MIYSTVEDVDDKYWLEIILLRVWDRGELISEFSIHMNDGAGSFSLRLGWLARYRGCDLKMSRSTAERHPAQDCDVFLRISL